ERSSAPACSTERTTPTLLAGMARPISVPTAARPEARPSACHNKMAAAGERRGQLACASAEAPSALPMATTARSAASSSPVISLAATFDHFQGVAQHFSLDARYGLCEPSQRRCPVTGLIQCGQHELGHIGLAGSGGAVTPGAPIALPPGEALFREPVEHRHHGGVS